MSADLSVILFWLFSGLIIWVLDRYVHFSFKHLFAFAAILLLIVGMVFRLPLWYSDPLALMVLGLSVSALQLSSYLSGTPRHSGRLYSILLITAALLTQWLRQDPMQVPIWHGMLVLTGLSALYMLLDRIIEDLHPWITPLEALLWGVSLILYWIGRQQDLAPTLVVIPWLMSLILIQYRRWRLTHWPAPLFTILAVLTTILLGHGLLALPPDLVVVEFVQRALILAFIALAGLLALWLRVLPAAFFMYYLSQEALLSLGIIPIMAHDLSRELMFWRLLFYLTINALFVMAEAHEFEPLDLKRIKGLARFRPRIAFAMTFYMVVLACEPLIIGHLHPDSGFWLVLLHMALGLVLAIKWAWPMLQVPEQDYVYLRPSLSTWVLVVFIMFIVLAYALNRLILLFIG